jgi:hypothetical protein
MIYILVVYFVFKGKVDPEVEHHCSRSGSLTDRPLFIATQHEYASAPLGIYH